MPYRLALCCEVYRKDTNHHSVQRRYRLRVCLRYINHQRGGQHTPYTHMGCDLDRRCQRQQRELAATITRIDDILERRHMHTNRRNELQAHRDALVLEHHDTQRSHDRYDARLREAREDGTGQDEDAFYERYGETDSVSDRYNEAGEPRW
jgi:hypothetical protein